MKDIFGIFTERRIQEAIARGDFKNLPGAGKPLKIEGLYFLPRKLRGAYIVLKNSGYIAQTSKESDSFPLSVNGDPYLPDGNPSISRQELSEKVYNRNVMMDCRNKR